MSTTVTTPDLATPKVGQPIAVAFFDGNHLVHFSVAHVLSLGPVDPATGKPTISVAYPDPDADLSVLSSASWFKGYVRRTGVQHVSSPDVQESRVSIGYGNPVDLAAGAEPSIPTPAGDAANPIFDRADDTLPSHVSLGQNSINQGSKRETVESPLVNDEFTKSSGIDGDAGDWTKTEGAGLTDNTKPVSTAEVAPFSIGAKVHFSVASGNNTLPIYTVKGIETGQGENPLIFNTLEEIAGVFLPQNLSLASTPTTGEATSAPATEPETPPAA